MIQLIALTELDKLLIEFMKYCEDNMLSENGQLNQYEISFSDWITENRNDVIQ